MQQNKQNPTRNKLHDQSRGCVLTFYV